MAMTFVQMVAEARAAVTEISADEFHKQSDAGCVLIDVREAEEYEAGHVTGAIHIPRGVIEMEMDNNPEFIDRQRSIVLICRSGGRSALAALSIEKLGFSNVKSLMGGFQSWEALGLPTTR
ncbi:MAG TPA: rhodanese-like domain-containing protein [Aeromonadales bacterium]|nr:rhodanese-like domain-containing protein [Aeromonadales bacterium]